MMEYYGLMAHYFVCYSNVKNIFIILIISKWQSYNCNINGDCSKLDGQWQHCIRYDCDACAIRDNLAEIFGQLMEDNDNIDNVYYTLKKLFTLPFCYWRFGQPDKEKYNPYFDHLNLSLSAFAACRCTWEIYLKK